MEETWAMARKSETSEATPVVVMEVLKTPPVEPVVLVLAPMGLAWLTPL
jgi:hypothetical protein